MPSVRYPEYVWSKWHPWFVEMGYPLLDVNRYEDGEWAIILWHTRPTVPAITNWQNVLSGMRNVDITRGFCEKYVKQLDIQRREFWAREQRASEKAALAHERQEKHAEEFAEKASEAVTRNEDLMNRIAKDGMDEMNPIKIGKRIPYYKF